MNDWNKTGDDQEEDLLRLPEIHLQQGLGVLKNEIARLGLNLLVNVAESERASIAGLNIASLSSLIATRRSDAAFSCKSAEGGGRGGSLNDVVLNAIAEHASHIAGAGR